jgi:peptidoglycan/xylan/chitin deacetylase (PgdA/CDA1 family)
MVSLQLQLSARSMRFHWLLPSVKGIPVLMYHRIWPGLRDGLTLTPEQLREQWLFLKTNGYQCLSLPAFLDIARGVKPKPEKAFLLTFDDGYRNNLTYVYPLLQELGWCATVFIIGDTLDGTATPVNSDTDEKLTVAELKSMDPEIIQLGLHGYHHENFKGTPPAGIEDALRKSMQAFENAGLPYHKALAYPYGARPKDAAALKQVKDIMRQLGIAAAFRIGNRPASVPANDLYEIKRIDIRGEDSLRDFKIKLKKGKLKPF